MHLKEKISNLPGSPGVYKFLDKDEKVIYVGKAKNLKKRVSSYFNKNIEHGKTRLLVQNIRAIDYIAVGTELDALLLENVLIKEYRPRYNIQLRDDKTYPWIFIKKERFPRVGSTRTLEKDGTEYYGPFASVKVMKTLLDLIRNLFPLRTCSYVLSEENIKKKKYSRCLEFHLGNCLAPCEGLQTESSYNSNMKLARGIIRGDLAQILRTLKQEMKAKADSFAYEEAQELKEKIELVEKYKAKSTVVNPRITDVDVFGICEDGLSAYVNYIRVKHGAILHSHTIEVRKKMDEPLEELVMFAIVDLRQRFESASKDIYVSDSLSLPDIDGLKFTQVSRGEKRKLVEVSEKNAKFFMFEKHKQEKTKDPDRHTNRILKTIQEDLRLPELPVHIECFDNSNFQGSNPVASCVVFKNVKPSKKEYRHFNIKTVEGIDDFASMTEVVHRRYKRLLDEGEPLPQLIVIDGGKGQLSAAVESLDRLGLRGKISIVGIAKKLEEIYFPGDSIPLYIDKKSESLKVLQRLRNEAHRFGIKHHRNKRSKAALNTSLTNVPGIGAKTAERLLKRFKSVKRLGEASVEDIAKEVGEAKAKAIKAHLLG